MAEVSVGLFEPTTSTGTTAESFAHNLSTTPDAVLLFAASTGKALADGRGGEAFRFYYSTGSTANTSVNNKKASLSIGRPTDGSTIWDAESSVAASSVLTIKRVDPFADVARTVNVASFDTTNVNLTYPTQTTDASPIGFIAFAGLDAEASTVWTATTSPTTQEVALSTFRPHTLLNLFGGTRSVFTNAAVGVAEDLIVEANGTTRFQQKAITLSRADVGTTVFDLDTEIHTSRFMVRLHTSANQFFDSIEIDEFNSSGFVASVDAGASLELLTIAFDGLANAGHSSINSSGVIRITGPFNGTPVGLLLSFAELGTWSFGVATSASEVSMAGFASTEFADSTVGSSGTTAPFLNAWSSNAVLQVVSRTDVEDFEISLGQVSSWTGDEIVISGIDPLLELEGFTVAWMTWNTTQSLPISAELAASFDIDANLANVAKPLQAALEAAFDVDAALDVTATSLSPGESNLRANARLEIEAEVPSTAGHDVIRAHSSHSSSPDITRSFNITTAPLEIGFIPRQNARFAFIRTSSPLRLSHTTLQDGIQISSGGSVLNLAERLDKRLYLKTTEAGTTVENVRVILR